MPSTIHASPIPLMTPERELEDAFESDNDDDGHSHSERAPLNTNNVVPGAYDFERDYDYPPPGSPPGPSEFALPNNIGNTNGQIPASPVETRSPPRPSIFRRVVGAVLPTHYVSVPTQPAPSVRGGGTENDGVFANVMAKPGRQQVVRAHDGNVHMVPEGYSEGASASVFPSFLAHSYPFIDLFESHTMKPKLMPSHPTGNHRSRTSGARIRFRYDHRRPSLRLCLDVLRQHIHFVLLPNYRVHSHAFTAYFPCCKIRSRAGLGLTLIQYGFYYRSMESDDATEGDDAITWPPIPVATPDSTGASTAVTNLMMSKLYPVCQ